MGYSLSTPALASILICIVCGYVLPLDLNKPALAEKNQRHFAYSHFRTFKLPKEVAIQHQSMITDHDYIKVIFHKGIFPYSHKGV